MKNNIKPIKNSVKAALFSAAILPGAGFFLLRHYLLGICFLSVPMAFLIYLLQHYLHKVLAVTEQLVQGHLPPDLARLVAEVLAETDPDKAQWLLLAKWGYVLSWFAGILASAFAGHLRDKKMLARAEFRANL